MLAGALIFAVGASGTPPNVTTDFCCTLEQWVLVNSTSGPLPPPNTTWQPGSRFKLCIDTTNKRWSREGEGVDTQRFNGTDRFTLTKNTSAPGGYNCVQKTFGPPKEPLGMPWQMVDIDVDASADGTETFDGIASVARWVHDRPKKGMFPAGNMTWHIAPGTNPSMLRTSYVTAAEPPAPGVTSGEREFSLYFTTTLPSFNPPPGVVCASLEQHLPAGGQTASPRAPAAPSAARTRLFSGRRERAST